MPRIGYWNAYTAYSDSYLADEITANGFEAVSLMASQRQSLPVWTRFTL